MFVFIFGINKNKYAYIYITFYHNINEMKKMNYLNYSINNINTPVLFTIMYINIYNIIYLL
jgi:hypothetical protein